MSQKIKYENGRSAIDWFTKAIKKWNHERGNEITHAEAQRQATVIAERAEKRVEKKNK